MIKQFRMLTDITTLLETQRMLRREETSYETNETEKYGKTLSVHQIIVMIEKLLYNLL